MKLIAGWFGFLVAVAVVAATLTGMLGAIGIRGGLVEPVSIFGALALVGWAAMKLVK